MFRLITTKLNVIFVTLRSKPKFRAVFVRMKVRPAICVSCPIWVLLSNRDSILIQSFYRHWMVSLHIYNCNLLNRYHFLSYFSCLVGFLLVDNLWALRCRNSRKKHLTTLPPHVIIYKQSNEAYRGVEQLEARRAHNPEVVGSSPASATIKTPDFDKKSGVFLTFKNDFNRAKKPWGLFWGLR